MEMPFLIIWWLYWWYTLYWWWSLWKPILHWLLLSDTITWWWKWKHSDMMEIEDWYWYIQWSMAIVILLMKWYSIRIIIDSHSGSDDDTLPMIYDDLLILWRHSWYDCLVIQLIPIYNDGAWHYCRWWYHWLCYSDKSVSSESDILTVCLFILTLFLNDLLFWWWCCWLDDDCLLHMEVMTILCEVMEIQISVSYCIVWPMCVVLCDYSKWKCNVKCLGLI
jgi:hypothetical protein